MAKGPDLNFSVKNKNYTIFEEDMLQGIQDAMPPMNHHCISPT